MNKIRLGFLGGGRITKIFLKALFANNIDEYEIVVFDCSPDALTKLKTMYPNINSSDNIDSLIDASILFLAVHPPVLHTAISGLKNKLDKDSIIISLAPKIKINDIKKALDNVKVARVIPNVNTFINKGFNPICFSNDINDNDKKVINSFFSILGKSIEVSENKLEAYAIISAMSPTFFFFQWKALSDIAVNELSLSENEFKNAFYHTLSSSADLYFNYGLTYEEIYDLIPGKPLQSEEQNIINIYKTKLNEIYNKIK